MIDTILWDVDGTLLNFRESEKYAFNTCLAQAGITPCDDLLAAYSQINLSFWKRLERGELTKEQLLNMRFPAFFEAAGISGVDLSLFRDTYQKLLGSVYFFQDGALELCTQLKGAYRQYVVTNGVARTQRDRLSLSGLDVLMDGIFISEELGCEKPDPVFFDRCFARIPGHSRTSAMIIGDSLTSDIQGGINAGITCCWYNPDGIPLPEDMKPEYIIRDLWEVPGILMGKHT